MSIYQFVHVEKVILNILWKLAETKAEAAALHSTQGSAKLLVERYLNK